ncbi:MAG: hypothetical protein QN174_05885 [Armatimonadota bacterium]|nr:hypothetical protein [Armatimonadota bacterium]
MRTSAAGGERGWAAIELVIALTLLALAAAGLWGLGGTASRVSVLHAGRLDAQQGARRALDRVTEELRWAAGVLPDPGCGPAGLCPDRVAVVVPPGNPYQRDQAYLVTFRYNPLQREVERRVAGGVNNLASLVERVTFTYFDAAGQLASDAPTVARIGVSLTLVPRDGYAVTVEGEVGLRNWRLPYVRPSPTRAWRPTPDASWAPLEAPDPSRSRSAGGWMSTATRGPSP